MNVHHVLLLLHKKRYLVDELGGFSAVLSRGLSSINNTKDKKKDTLERSDVRRNLPHLSCSNKQNLLGFSS